MIKYDEKESYRLSVQARLDAEKDSQERNRMGQFATPTLLAREIVDYGIKLLPQNEKIHFLDPAVGTGAFYSALEAVAPEGSIEKADGFEIDPHYGIPAQTLWADSLLNIQIKDFTSQPIEESSRANLIICNPPYVRHQHLEEKQKKIIQSRTQEVCGIKLSGLSGLYCYFMGLSHQWMKPDGIAGWLVPSEFMSVNYGKALKDYLLGKVTLIRIHRYNPKEVQFTDALVSSAIVWVKNTPPPKDHKVIMSYGGTLGNPEVSREVKASELASEVKWTRYPQASTATIKAKLTLGDLFDIKRGLATGDNKFFILTNAQIEKKKLPKELFTPVLPGARYILNDEILSDEDGTPSIEKKLFLLNTQLPENEIASKYPMLKSYLDEGKSGEEPIASRYLCRNRKPWYKQENRPAAPIICTYMGRDRKGRRPFRFILNHSEATACNGYLMLYPKPSVKKISEQDPDIMRKIWEYLNNLDITALLSQGRVYGGGLHKLEPKELRGLPVENLLDLVPVPQEPGAQGDLLQEEVA